MVGPEKLIHEAFIYSSDEEFAAVAVPFLREAVVADQQAIAVTTDDRIRLLRGELGGDAAAVSFFDADDWYTRPGAAVLAWRGLLGEQRGNEGPLVRAIGEVRLGAGVASHTQWMRYESLFNRTFAHLPVWVMCPYDTRSVPKKVLADVRRTHPVVSTTAGREPSPEHFSSQELGALLAPLRSQTGAGAAEGARTVVASERELALLRRCVTWPALAAGLPRDAIEDLLLAVTELARAALARVGGSASVCTSRIGAEWCCEVTSAGGSGDAAALVQNGIPLMIGRVVCDRLEVGGGPGTFVVRFVFGPRRDPRERILAAASELFAQNGLRAAGVNAIIARAGVAKATFYSCFSSKDELILEWVRSPETRWFRDVWSEVEARTEAPAERLTQFFDVLGEWLTETDFRSWPLLATAAEITSAVRPAREELARGMADAQDHFLRAATAAGLDDPAQLAAQLFLLVTGAVTASVIARSRQPVDAAHAAAVHLVAASTPRTPRRRTR